MKRKRKIHILDFQNKSKLMCGISAGKRIAISFDVKSMKGSIFSFDICKTCLKQKQHWWKLIYPNKEIEDCIEDYIVAPYIPLQITAPLYFDPTLNFKILKDTTLHRPIFTAIQI